MSAQEDQVALPLRSHTILGVCEAIGEDFHFNPVILRVILAAGVLYSPLLAIGTYFGLGVLILVSRVLFPNVKLAPAASEEAPSNDEQELKKAA
jgi:phage shock protein PspC (stress-responsive transcriptional regulator)